MPAKILVEDVSKSYASDKGPLQAVDSISFEVGDGEVVVVVGPSGCGKSTLMNIIAGFDRPDQGCVSIDGAVRTEPSSRGILISQHGSVFPWLTVQENVELGLEAQGVARMDAIKQVARTRGLSKREVYRLTAITPK